jgi:hypothetical protein
LVVHDADDRVCAQIECEDDGPWQIRDDADMILGELVAGEPGPSLAPRWYIWVDPKWAMSDATDAQARARSRQIHRDFKHCSARCDTAMRRAHTCGMEVCHFIAVALTAAPLPAPRFFRWIQASATLRLA